MRYASTACRRCILMMLMAACALGAAAARAHAQGITETDPRLIPAGRKTESIERFIVELRGGPASPDVTRDATYGTFFRGDSGPNLGFQLDGVVYRQPKWFYLTVGGSFSTISFKGHAIQATDGTPASEETTLYIIPLTAVAGLRFDGLARRYSIPLVFTGRVGWEWAHWNTGTGSRTDATGWSLGPVFAVQAAFDLDIFQPDGARNLDEEWGINHTYLFAELYHFEPVGKSLQLGDTSWLLGLGFVL
jgi:hypothetical protein